MQPADHFCELVRRNRTAEAKRFLQDAGEDLARVPRVQRALASMLYDEGDVDRAIGLYRSLFESQGHPGDAEVLGWLLLQARRFGEAAECYGEWVRRWPDQYRFWAAYADSLEAQGDREEAKRALRRTVELEPGAGRAWYSLTRLGDYDWIHERRERLLSPSRPAGDPVGEFSREFAAGRYLESRGEWQDAFQRLRHANALRRRAGAMDVRGTISAARKVMQDWRVQDWASATTGHESRAPIFIVGMPRSGTTLVEQMLVSHPDVAGLGERPFLKQEITATLRGSNRPIAQLDWQDAGRRYLDRVRAVLGDADRFTDKMLFNFNSLGFIRRIFPGARIVHCRRDPLDTCVSCFRTKFESMNLSYDLRELGWLYGYYDGLMAFWREQFGDAIIDVQYEALVKEPDRTLAGLLADLDLPWSDACLRFHENRRVARTASLHQVNQPLYESAIGRAEPYRQHLGPLEEAIEEARAWMRAPEHA